MKPMYKLLIKLFKLLSKQSDFTGLCYISSLMPNEENLKLRTYIDNHKVLNYYFRKLRYNHFNRVITFAYYWKEGTTFLRKWYLIRHIFYCWLYYWCKKLF